MSGKQQAGSGYSTLPAMLPRETAVSASLGREPVAGSRPWFEICGGGINSVPTDAYPVETLGYGKSDW